VYLQPLSQSLCVLRRYARLTAPGDQVSGGERNLSTAPKSEEFNAEEVVGHVFVVVERIIEAVVVLSGDWVLRVLSVVGGVEFVEMHWVAEMVRRGLWRLVFTSVVRGYPFLSLVAPFFLLRVGHSAPFRSHRAYSHRIIALLPFGSLA
jgi:hypothetical protein